MTYYEDDTPYEIPEHLKNLTAEQLHARVEELFAKLEKKHAEQSKNHPLGA